MNEETRMSTREQKSAKEPAKKSDPSKKKPEELSDQDLDRTVGGTGTVGSLERGVGTVGNLSRKDPYKN